MSGFFCVPNRKGPDEIPVVHIFLSTVLAETRANITIEVTPELIQEMRDAADRAEQVLALNTKAKAIKARFDAEMSA